MVVSAQRLLRVGAFDVHSDVSFLADRDVPILVVFDLTSKAVRSTHAWPLLSERRDRSVANEVLYRDGVVVVASPAAGGIVRIDPDDGYLGIIDLDEDVGSLLASGSHLWAIGAPDWLENSPGPQTIGTRPVVWEEVTGDPRTSSEVPAFISRARGQPGSRRPPPLNGGKTMTVIPNRCPHRRLCGS